jgi:hypothetical protein
VTISPGIALHTTKVDNLNSSRTTGEVTMNEIRLAWSIVGRENLVNEPIQGGLWTPDNPEIRKELTIIMESGNEAYGPDTHWIEEREA